MTKAERSAVIETLDDASLATANAFQRAAADAGTSLNSFQIAAMNAFGLAMDHVRSIPATDEGEAE